MEIFEVKTSCYERLMTLNEGSCPAQKVSQTHWSLVSDQ